MRASKEEKQQSRERIVAAAARLFREAGVQGASVADVMSAAGMTHGGFYRHFPDKDRLLVAAISSALEDLTRPLLAAADPIEAVRMFRARYLSQDHLESPGQGCPAAALGQDIARAGGDARAAFTDGLSELARGLARGLGTEHQEGQARRRALREMAMLVGAVVLARAADGSLADEILDACKEMAASD